MKRIFISVGSESTTVLAELVQRLSDENLFDKFVDEYISFDSMKDGVEKFNRLAIAQRTERIRGHLIKITDNDENAIDAIQPKFEKTMPTGGVGGQRQISMVAVDSIKAALDPVITSEKLAPTDQIVVIGSAFGGTSGGMFLNVCQYLDKKIRALREGAPINSNTTPTYGNVEVLGFLLMPDAMRRQPEGGRYPVALNLIDMLKDLQTASWRRRLECTYHGFKVPLLTNYSSMQDGGFQFDDHKDLHEYGIDNSTLPMCQLFLLPTNNVKSQHVKTVCAEVLFAACYLGLGAGHDAWVNRFHAGARTSLEYEDTCLAGFNMFAMKSGRTISLKNWFYKGLISALEGLLNSQTDKNPTVEGNIKRVFEQAQCPGKNTPYIGVDSNEGALHDLLKELDQCGKSISSFTEFMGKCPELLDSLKAADKLVAPFDVIPPREFVVILSNEKFNSWNCGVNFQLIQKTYDSFYAEIIKAGQNANICKANITKAMETAKKLLENRPKSRVVRNSIWGLSHEEDVIQEIITKFQETFKTLLKNYLFACRCSKTVLLKPEQFKQTLDDFAKICAEIAQTIKQQITDLNDDGNCYVIEGVLVDKENLKLPDQAAKKLIFNPLEITVAAAYKKQTSEISTTQLTQWLENAGANGIDYIKQTDPQQILDHAEEKSISSFVQATKDLSTEGNPLSKATLANFAEKTCHTYADAYKLSNSGPYHYHFAVQLGSLPRNFSMTNQAITELLPSMPYQGDLGMQFNTQNQKTDDGNSWQDNRHDRILIDAAGKEIDSDIQGLWIGTLGIDFAIKSVLDNLYGNYRQIKNNWVTESWNERSPRRLMTTAEMVRFGLIIQAIEEKIKDYADKGRDDTFKISFEKDADKVFDLPEVTKTKLQIVDENMVIHNLPKQLVKAIFNWLRSTDDNGFSKFFGPNNLSSIERTEENIFEGIRFSIKREEINEIEKLKENIKKYLQINVRN